MSPVGELRIETTKDALIYVPVQTTEDGDIEWDGDYVGFGDLQLMQYTGIKNANGQELYESDIIENDSEWWQIVFTEGKFMCDPINGGNVYMDLEELGKL